MAKVITPDHDFKVGDILVSIWGYEQTNVDYYQVVGITAKSVKIHPIMSSTTESGYMCGTCTPCRGAYIKNIFMDGVTTKRVNYGCVRIARGIYAHKWDGKPHYCSWYY